MKTPLDRTLSRVLLAGLLLAVVLMLVGTVLAGTGTGGSTGRASSISDMPRALGALEPGGFFDLGLLVLLATPVVRVIALILGFTRAKAYLFSGISLLVLALVVLCAVLGLLDR